MRPHPTDANSKFSFGAGIREAAYNYFSGGMEVIGHFMTRDTSIKKCRRLSRNGIFYFCR